MTSKSDVDTTNVKTIYVEIKNHHRLIFKSYNTYVLANNEMTTFS